MLSREQLLHLLQTEGGDECMSREEIAECLGLLVGSKEFSKLPAEIQADDFAENVLGFEEVEEVEEEEGDYTG